MYTGKNKDADQPAVVGSLCLLLLIYHMQKAGFLMNGLILRTSFVYGYVICVRICHLCMGMSGYGTYFISSPEPKAHR